MSRFFLNNPGTESDFSIDAEELGAAVSADNTVVLTSEVMSKLEQLFLDVGIIPSLDFLDYMTMIKVSGGITNALYIVSLIGETTTKVVLRLFGAGTELFIDRKTENAVFAHLSTVGYGPVFLGLFKNGRLEGFLNDMRSLVPEEMWLPPICHQVATNIAFLHDQNIEEVKSTQERWMWNKIGLFFDLASKLTFADSETKRIKFEQIDLLKMKSEIDWLETFILNLIEFLKSAPSTPRNIGRSFALDIGLCHNDLLSGNIMRSGYDIDESTTAKLIDYEYAGYNYRGYDVANHFCEFGGFEFDIRNRFPSQELRQDFIRAYLTTAWTTTDRAHLATEQEVIEGFEEIVQIMTLASHMFWGTWSVVQGGTSTVDFDYLGYAQLRYEAVDYHKQLFNIGFDKMCQKHSKNSGCKM